MTNKLHELLETRNRKEQVARVQALKQAAQSPVIDLVVRFDGRAGQVVQVEAIGGKIGIGAALELLEGARVFLLAKQKAAQDREEPAPEDPKN